MSTKCSVCTRCDAYLFPGVINFDYGNAPVKHLKLLPSVVPSNAQRIGVPSK